MSYDGFKDVLSSLNDDTETSENEKYNKKETEIFSNESSKNTLNKNDIQNLQREVFEENYRKSYTSDKNSQQQNTKNIHAGHRQRAIERFLLNPDETSDYDLLELLLFLIIPRVDTKKMAKSLIDDHKTLKNIFNLSAEKISKYHVNGKTFKYLTVLLKTVNKRLSKQELDDGCIINDYQKLINYCQDSLGMIEEEQFRILFFNSKLKLIDDINFGLSGISSVIISFRDIIKKCLDLKANSVILCHNHPNQDPSPSKEDIAITDKVIDLLKSIDVEVIDHIIISNGKYFSFKYENLL